MPEKMPVGFVGHGAPMVALDADKGAPLRAWGTALGRPEAFLVLSAHWFRPALNTGTEATTPLMYDFSGFPRELSEVEYESPGAPALARRVAGLLGTEHPTGRRPERPLDHGVWTPLVHMRPDADVPVLQLALPSHYSAEQLFDLGRDLAPLRDEGVFILGSGNLTHNLRAMGPDGGEPEAWARRFDDWIAGVLDGGDVSALLEYRERSPDLSRNHPTVEHFVPVIVAAGAGGLGDEGTEVSFPVLGWEYTNLSRRAVQLG